MPNRVLPFSYFACCTFFVDEHALVCVVAAQLLQLGKDVPSSERLEAMAHICTILADETLSRRPLDAPDGEILRLDDLLYDVLSMLAEK